MPETAAAASPILTHAMAEAARMRQSSASENETKIVVRDFIMTAPARSTEPVGPCSASRCPYTMANEAMQSVKSAKAMVHEPAV